MPKFNDTSDNQLLGYFRESRLLLDPLFIVIGIVGCVLAVLYLENIYARVGVAFLAACWTAAGFGMCCIHCCKSLRETELKQKETKEESTKLSEVRLSSASNVESV